MTEEATATKTAEQEASEKYWAMTLAGLKVEVARVPKGCWKAGKRSTKAGCIAILKERDRRSATVRGLTGLDHVEDVVEEAGEMAAAAAAAGAEALFGAAPPTCAGIGPSAPAEPCEGFVPTGEEPATDAAAAEAMETLIEETRTEFGEAQVHDPERGASSGEEKGEVGAEEGVVGEDEGDPGAVATGVALTDLEVAQIVATAVPDETTDDPRLVKFPLSKDDRADLADEMAERLGKVVGMQAKRRDDAAALKKKIDAELEDLYRLGVEVKTGRDVAKTVEIRRYWQHNLRVVVMPDEGEGETILSHRALKGSERQDYLRPSGAAQGDDSGVGCGACGAIPADTVDADGGPLCLGCAEEMRGAQGEGTPSRKTCGACLYLLRDELDPPTCVYERGVDKIIELSRPACEVFMASTPPPACGDCDGFNAADGVWCIPDEEAKETDAACRAYRPKAATLVPEPFTCGTCDHRQASGRCDPVEAEVEAEREACGVWKRAKPRCHACRYFGSAGCSYGVTEDPDATACEKYEAEDRGAEALAVAGAFPPAPGSPADKPLPPAAPGLPGVA